MSSDKRGICSEATPENSIGKIDSWNESDQQFTLSQPDEDNLSFSKIAVMPKAMLADKPGIVHLDGFCIVEKAAGETINVGDTVGTKKDSWKVRQSEGGAFLVFAVDNKLVVRPTAKDYVCV